MWCHAKVETRRIAGANVAMRQADAAPCPCRRHRAGVEQKDLASGACAGNPGLRNREASMNRMTAGIVFTIGVGVAALAGTASAQNSPGVAALDTSLRGAVEA